MSSSKVLNNLNIRKFPSLESYKSATIGEDDLNVVMGGKPLIQVTALPTPSADWHNEVIQLIADDQQGNWQNGFFRCDFDGTDYYWTQVDTQPAQSYASKNNITADIIAGTIGFELSDSFTNVPAQAIYSDTEILVDINTDPDGLTNTNHFSARVRLDSTYSGDQTIYEATGIFAGLKAYIASINGGLGLVFKRADDSPITNTYITQVAYSVSLLGVQSSGWSGALSYSTTPWSSATLLPEASSGGASVDTATITLAAADWVNNEQTVTATGVTSSNTVIVGAAPASLTEYNTCAVVCTAQGTDSLTFGCTTTPQNDLTVTVLILS